MRILALFCILLAWIRAQCVEVVRDSPKAQGRDGKDGPEVIAANLSGQENSPAKPQNLQGTGVEASEEVVKSRKDAQVTKKKKDGCCRCNFCGLLGCFFW